MAKIILVLPTLFAVVLAVLGDVALYQKAKNYFSGEQGYVLYSVNGVVSFINGSKWNYLDAMVVCRELSEFYLIISFKLELSMNRFSGSSFICK